MSVVQALGAIAQDREHFQRAADLALQTKDGSLPAEEAARQIAQGSPEVASLLDRVPAAARKFFTAVLISAITILADQAVSALRDHSATPADVERIVATYDRDISPHEVQVAVDRAFKEYLSQHPPTPEPPRATKPPTKDGR